MYEFDEDTRLVSVSEDRFDCELSPRWNIGAVPNGGYVMAVAQRGLSELLPHPDMLTVSGHYLLPTQAGPATLLCERVREGRGTSTAMVRLVQDDRERARFIGTAGRFDEGRSPDDHHHAGPPQEIPPPEQCVISPQSAPQPSIRQRFDVRHAPASSGWMREEGEGRACSGGQIRFADGRPADVASLAIFCDSYQPTIVNHFGRHTGWVPTLQLTTQYRARPVDGYLRAWFVTRHLTGGLHEEDGELWDESGTLVALSRQLARVRLPDAN